MEKTTATKILEIPAGKLDDREDPAAHAVRELAEEVRMKPKHLRQIAFYYSSPGFASEKLYIYLATEVEPADVANQRTKSSNR
jgi:ADP-ribose pyrophosphatase